MRLVAEPSSKYADLTPEQVAKRIGQLEKKMFQHARDLEFEEAARLRDEIQELRKGGLGLPDTKAG